MIFKGFEELAKPYGECESIGQKFRLSMNDLLTTLFDQEEIDDFLGGLRKPPLQFVTIDDMLLTKLDDLAWAYDLEILLAHIFHWKIQIFLMQFMQQRLGELKAKEESIFPEALTREMIRGTYLEYLLSYTLADFVKDIEWLSQHRQYLE